MKVSSPDSSYLGVADTWWQLEHILKEASHAHSEVRVEESVFQLPTMLITTKVMNCIHAAINEHRLEDAPISKCIRLGSMDTHMPGFMQSVSAHSELFSSLR